MASSDAQPNPGIKKQFRITVEDPNLAKLLGTSELTVRQPGEDSGFTIEARLSQRQVKDIFADTGAKYPEIMTYEQAAEMVQVSVSTLKGWFSEGRYANCVKRGKPGRVLRNAFVKEFMKDDFG